MHSVMFIPFICYGFCFSSFSAEFMSNLDLFPDGEGSEIADRSKEEGSTQTSENDSEEKATESEGNSGAFSEVIESETGDMEVTSPKISRRGASRSKAKSGEVVMKDRKGDSTVRRKNPAK
ncbi:uncharacterized protein LOC122057511 [Macadamia integrifolia]|uniref:uncharacterized protein LOC122057511 n=1 Tax=Macadamia integrifolia TaxID=60698 RepID=UPI001C52808D|nr:uncharacterized protein LOC122057511 [Macadamia integrifolia]